jgi:hypothetical protein
VTTKKFDGQPGSFSVAHTKTHADENAFAPGYRRAPHTNLRFRLA